MSLINYRYKHLDKYLNKIMKLLFKTKFRPLSELDSIFNKLSADLVECVVENPEQASKYIVDEEDNFYLPYHSINTAIYSISAAFVMGATTDELHDISKGALLHDAGMVEISEEIFNKEGKLSVEELFIIQQHPEYGVPLIEKCNENVKKIVKSHHESYCGGGYPQGGPWRVDNDFSASIVSISDAFDAMISHRVYKSSISVDEAKLILLEDSDFKWDRRYVDSFIDGLKRIA